ncbi:MAG: aminotransferase class V-fold PLP-dependent enzyme [Corynebacterium sp.]|uniref:aminotransferase class V-fold PLP-dependent enzyme n=1 Tax=Corynebacterium sp. TaxID=1720 RepID=UPI0026DF0FDD|nr:aminotransferase class V-fold PLP-dependent enzyme [Corynebacterium sp.]MDO5668422.1 aminotransferase class V-fold PLP-dependent enzyme [Corynebacterium sp.]
MAMDVAKVRGQYLSLGDGWTYLNAHQCPQIPERVSVAVSRAFRRAPVLAETEQSSGSHSRLAAPGSLQGASLIDDARRAVADLCAVTPDRVILGPDLSVLYLRLAQAMRPLLRRTSSLVLSGLDDPALTGPFAELGGAVRYAQPDLGTGALPASQYRELVDGSTRLVALSAAHPHLGTVAPVADIVELTRSRSRAWVLIDATAYLPYRPLSVADWDADIVALDIAALGGPPIAALVFRDPAMFRRIDPLPPMPIVAGLAGGVPALVDHLAELAEGGGTRRTRLQRSMTQLGEYLADLAADLHMLLGTLPAVHILGASGEAGDGGRGDRIPRLSFAVRGVPASTVHQRLLDNSLVTTILPESQLATDMGVDEVGGAVTVSLSPFTIRHDLEHLTRVVASLA